MLKTYLRLILFRADEEAEEEDEDEEDELERELEPDDDPDEEDALEALELDEELKEIMLSIKTKVHLLIIQ